MTIKEFNEDEDIKELFGSKPIKGHGEVHKCSIIVTLSDTTKIDMIAITQIAWLYGVEPTIWFHPFYRMNTISSNSPDLVADDVRYVSASNSVHRAVLDQDLDIEEHIIDTNVLKL